MTMEVGIVAFGPPLGAFWRFLGGCLQGLSFKRECFSIGGWVCEGRCVALCGFVGHSMALIGGAGRCMAEYGAVGRYRML